MKKILVLLFAVILSSTLAQAKIPEDNMNRPPMPPRMDEQQRLQHEKAFEQRLELTEEQIQKSKELRLEGREKIKPVVEKIKAREREIQMVRQSNLDEKTQETKINSLHSDLRSLHKQAHDIKVENMKQFENILTVEQRKTLKEMKQEGRHEFNKHRVPPKPPEEK